MILSIEILLSICKTTISNFHFADFLKLSIYRQQDGMIDRHLNNYCNDFICGKKRYSNATLQYKVFAIVGVIQIKK